MLVYLLTKSLVMKKNIILILITLFALSVQAQNETDALRFSQSYYQGTARSMAMGGAFGALGADFSSLSINPAGLGLYRSSEFTLSPSLLYAKTTSTYNGMMADDFRSNFALSNLGFVATNKIQDGKTNTPWKYYQFAVGMNRTNAFHNRSIIQGENLDHSKIDVYLDRLGNTNPGDIEFDFPYDLYPAWYVYLLDTVRDPSGNLVYTSPVPIGGILQTETLNSWGSTNEWVFSAGANLDDKVFFGATLGLPYTRFYRETAFTERDVNDEYEGFEEWTYKETLESHGMGINLKVGVIAWPLDWLRVGLAFHTPTYYSEMQDIWYTSTEAKLEPDYNVKTSPTGDYVYEVTTPLRAIGSAAFIIGQFGAVTADYEFVDYTKMRLRAADYSFSNENQNIRDFYTSTFNLRLGTEWRVNNFNFRGGYAMYGSPYNDGVNDGQKDFLSLGIGFNEKNFSLDLAYINGKMNQDYYLYSSPNYTTNAAKQELGTNQFVLTTRFKL